MTKKLVAIAFVLVLGTLSLAAAMTPLVYAQLPPPVIFPPTDESGTETEQEIGQKNVCSGWAVCTNDSENREDSVTGADTP
jgi:hypothetical protein